MAAMRRHWLLLLALLVVAPAHAQPWPAKPVRVMVGFTPGGGVDINARLLAQSLSESLGQQFIVENKPGAGTNIANDAVAKAPPDGYTLLFSSPTIAINMSLYKGLPYDTLRDLVGVSVFSETTNLLLVPASLPIKSVRELVALAREKPGSLNYSSSGSGSTQHLVAELFKLRTGTRIEHVPYRGSAPALTALIAGEVQLSVSNPVAVGSHIKSGRLRALALAGAKRSSVMPDVPTMKEAGIEGLEVPLWYGLLAPAATPREIIRTLATATAKAANAQDTRRRLLDQGAEPVGSSPEEFARLLRDEIPRYAEVVRISGARPE